MDSYYLAILMGTGKSCLNFLLVLSVIIDTARYKLICASISSAESVLRMGLPIKINMESDLMKRSSMMSLIEDIKLEDRSKSDRELKIRFSLPSILAFTRDYMSSRRIREMRLLLKFKFFNILNFDNVNKLLFNIASDGHNLFPSRLRVCNLSKC